MKPSADYWIEKLQLQKHPEGGSFRETYRAALEIERAHLPKKFSGQRNISTSIYFLLQKNEFSAFHRIASDELWHFYYGGALAIFEIDALTGSLFTHQLGGNFMKGGAFQTNVKAGNWFAAKVKNDYSLVGCTVSPGFDFADFELGERKKLIEKYPQHSDLINSLSR